MWETTNKFGEKYRKNQYKYWIDKDFTLPNNFSLGPNNLLVAMVLKENLKVFKNTDFQNKIDVLVDEIAVYVGKQGKTIKPGFFENLDTGISDYSILEDDLGEIIAAIISGCICTATYQNVGSREPVGIDFFPVKFLALKNTLYVLALNIDKREYRTYNLARFQPNSVTIHSHAKPNFKIPKLNWEEQRKKSFGIVYDKNVKKVKLEFLPGAVHYIKGRTWHFEPDISFRKNSNLIMKMEISITTELVSWIMRWMPNVIVHEPAELKEEVKKRLERSLKNNKW